MTDKTQPREEAVRDLIDNPLANQIATIIEQSLARHGVDASDVEGTLDDAGDILALSASPASGGVDAVAEALRDLCDAWDDKNGGGKYRGNVTDAQKAARAVLASLSPVTSGSVRCTYCGDTGTITDRVDGEIICPECGYSKQTSGSEAGGEAPEGKLVKRPVAFRICAPEVTNFSTLYYKTEDAAREASEQIGVDYEALYVRDGTPLNFAALATPAPSPAGGGAVRKQIKRLRELANNETYKEAYRLGLLHAADAMDLAADIDAEDCPSPAGGVREARPFDPYILKAMAANYAGGHSWDHLDGQACLQALALIESLQTQVAALSPATAVKDSAE